MVKISDKVELCTVEICMDNIISCCGLTFGGVHDSVFSLMKNVKMLIFFDVYYSVMFLFQISCRIRLEIVFILCIVCP